jgi:hypothetical protein
MRSIFLFGAMRRSSLRRLLKIAQLLFCTFLRFSVSEAATIEIVPADDQDSQLIVITGEIKIGDETKFAGFSNSKQIGDRGFE